MVSSGRRKKAPSESRRERLWNPSFVLILFVAFFCFIVAQGLNTGTSAYIVRSGGSSTYAGAVAMAFTLAAAIARISAGNVSDALSRYAVLMVGSGIMSLGIACVVFAPSLELMWLYRAIQGIGFAAVTTAAATAAIDVIPFRRIGEGISCYGLAQALAMTIGPGTALLLVSQEPPEAMYYVLFGCAVAMLASSFFCRYEKHPERLPREASYRLRISAGGVVSRSKPDERSIAGPSTRPPENKGSRIGHHAPKGFAGVFELQSLRGAMPAFFLAPVYGFGIFHVCTYAEWIGSEYGGAFYAIAAGAMILVRMVSGSYMDRYAEIKIYRVPVLAGVLAFLFLCCAERCSEFFLLAGLLYGVCMGMANPLNQTVSVKCAPENRRGAANGMYLLGTDLGVGISAATWGITTDAFGFRFTIVCVMASALLSYLVAMRTYPKS